MNAKIHESTNVIPSRINNINDQHLYLQMLMSSPEINQILITYPSSFVYENVTMPYSFHGVVAANE